MILLRAIDFMNSRSTFTISELADAGATTPRTVRYYTAEGLLPPPDSRGRYAIYSSDHLDRLRLIDRLKDAHQPLTAIRERLSGLTAEDIRELLADADSPRNPKAMDDLLVKCAEAARARLEAREEYGRHIDPFTGGVKAVATLFEKPLDGQIERDPEEDTWRRIMLAPGVELNVRVPIAADSAQRVEELMSRARELFDTGL